MANLNEAFKLQYQGKTREYYPIQTDDKELSAYFARVKVSDPKYDTMPKRSNKNPTYGYECKVCRGSVGYHMSIQNKYPHDFEKGNFRQLSEEESGRFN